MTPPIPTQRSPDGFDFDAAVTAPFRMQPGLRRLAPGARQLHALSPLSPVFAEKLGVVARHADDALLCAEGYDARPALQAFVAQAAACGAPELEADADGVAATQLGWRVCWDGSLATAAQRDAAPHPAAGEALAALPARQRLAGLLSLALHEDLAIVEGDAATLPWMAVCLPSHWSPAEKIGRTFAAVHGPVADNATLVAASQHLCRLVCEPQRWERFVWNLTAHRQLDQHPSRHARSGWPSDTATTVAAAHWRTEHQSFVPLPGLRQAVFTIHVEVQPLAQALATPGHAAKLHAALASMSDAVLAYRGLADAKAPLLAWLAARAAA